MNKDIRPSQHVLHVFEPNRICRPHDEVEFIKGRYVDIVNTKNKDPNTLYFGTSKKSDFLTGIFLGDLELTSKVKDGVSKVTNSVSTATAEVENSLNNFIEALAVMIVTSCVIPILVLVFFVWLIKIVLGVDVNLPKKI